MNKNNKLFMIIYSIVLFVIIGTGGFSIYKLNDELGNVKDSLSELDELKEENDYLKTQVSNLQTSFDSIFYGEGENTGYSIDAFEQIKMTNIVSESKGETIVVWLGMQGCGYCQAYAPLLEKVTNTYNIKAKYVDVSVMSEEDYNTLLSIEGINGYENFVEQFTGTPFTMILKDGKVIGGLDGYYDESGIIAEFERVGFRSN